MSSHQRVLQCPDPSAIKAWRVDTLDSKYTTHSLLLPPYSSVPTSALSHDPCNRGHPSGLVRQLGVSAPNARVLSSVDQFCPQAAPHSQRLDLGGPPPVSLPARRVHLKLLMRGPPRGTWEPVPYWREMGNGSNVQAHLHQKVWEHFWARKSHFSKIISAHKSQTQKNHYYRLMCSRWNCLQFQFSFILVSKNCMKSRTFHSHPLKPLVLFQRSLSWLFSRDCTRAVILASVHPPPGSWRKKAHSIPARSVAPRHQHQAGALWASHLH